MAGDRFQLSPASAEARYQALQQRRLKNPLADDPLFRPVDANDYRVNGDNATDYTNLREHALIRVTLPLPGNVRHGFTHFQLELAVVSGVGTTEGLWSRVERLGDHALPTLMKKVVRHAIAALATHPYGSAASSAAKSGSSPSAASLTGANESR